MSSFAPIVKKGFRPVLFPLIPFELMVVTSSTTSTGEETASGSLNKTGITIESSYMVFPFEFVWLNFKFLISQFQVGLGLLHILLSSLKKVLG